MTPDEFKAWLTTVSEATRSRAKFYCQSLTSSGKQLDAAALAVAAKLAQQDTQYE